MSTRRVALSLAALTALATMPVLAGTPAGASGAIVSPTARGEDNGDPEAAEDPSDADEPVDNCPTKQWTVPLELKGLACLLLLPKPEPGGDGGGGLGGLFG
ncbi:MAG TPA: hypothetical protein VFW57_10990 [Acidimicrobiia bacterium]|nr:hypothetical protein [Acidimicrobiia bacterium]